MGGIWQCNKKSFSNILYTKQIKFLYEEAFLIRIFFIPTKLYYHDDDDDDVFVIIM